MARGWTVMENHHGNRPNPHQPVEIRRYTHQVRRKSARTKLVLEIRKLHGDLIKEILKR
jgi:hypothetical protein